MDSRVGELSLTVRARGTARPGLGAAVEEFAARVLDRCAALLDAHAPERVICVRSLALRLRLREGTLAHDEEIDAVARELAASIEAQAGGPPEDGADAEIVTFPGEAQWAAALLRAAAAGDAPWWGASLVPDGALPGVLADADHAPTARGALATLAAAGDIAAVLAALPDHVTRAIARALGLGEPLAGSRGALATSRLLDIARHDAIARWLDDLPAALSRPALVLAGYGLLAHHLAVADPPREAIAGIIALHEARSAASSPPRAALTSGEDAATDDERAPVRPSGEELDGVATRAAGLVYLLRAALELDAGEILWRACLDERVVLARGWRRVAGAVAPSLVADPAIAILGGAAPDGHPGTLDAELRREVAPALLRALGSALARHGRVPPPLRLSLVHSPGERTLVGWLDGVPFAPFTWPGATLAELRGGVEAVSGSWPAPGVVVAPPALAALAPRGRVVTAAGPPASPLAVPALAALVATTDGVDVLVEQIAGAVVSLVAARAGWEAGTIPAMLGRAIELPGTIALTAEEIAVMVPMERVDLALRRGGVDRDPGWVPWLARTVRIVFRGVGDGPANDGDR